MALVLVVASPVAAAADTVASVVRPAASVVVATVEKSMVMEAVSAVRIQKPDSRARNVEETTLRSMMLVRTMTALHTEDRLPQQAQLARKGKASQ